MQNHANQALPINSSRRLRGGARYDSERNRQLPWKKKREKVYPWMDVVADGRSLLQAKELKSSIMMFDITAVIP